MWPVFFEASLFQGVLNKVFRCIFWCAILPFSAVYFSSREFQGLHATILSTLPASAGLGSSAALSVCVAAGCLSLVGAISSSPSQAKQHSGQLEEHLSESVAMERRAHNVALPQSVLERLSSQGIKITNSDTADLSMGWSASELETINRWGLEAEKLIHGTPSGTDNSVSTFGMTGCCCIQEHIHCVFKP